MLCLQHILTGTGTVTLTCSAFLAALAVAMILALWSPSFWPHFLPQYFQMLPTSIGSEESLFAATATQCLSSGCLDVGVERCFSCIDAPAPPTARVPWESLAARSDRQPESVARRHCALLRSKGANAGPDAAALRTSVPNCCPRSSFVMMFSPSATHSTTGRRVEPYAATKNPAVFLDHAGNLAPSLFNTSNCIFVESEAHSAYTEF